MNVFFADWLVWAKEIAKTTTSWTHELLLIHNFDCCELCGVYWRRDTRLHLRLCLLHWRGNARPIEQAFFIVGLGEPIGQQAKTAWQLYCVQKGTWLIFWWGRTRFWLWNLEYLATSLEGFARTCSLKYQISGARFYICVKGTQLLDSGGYDGWLEQRISCWALVCIGLEHHGDCWSEFGWETWRNGRVLCLDYSLVETIHVSGLKRGSERCHFVNNASKGPNIAFEVIRSILPDLRAGIIRRPGLRV